MKCRMKLDTGLELTQDPDSPSALVIGRRAAISTSPSATSLRFTGSKRASGTARETLCSRRIRAAKHVTVCNLSMDAILAKYPSRVLVTYAEAQLYEALAFQLRCSLMPKIFYTFAPSQSVLEVRLLASLEAQETRQVCSNDGLYQTPPRGDRKRIPSLFWQSKAEHFLDCRRELLRKVNAVNMQEALLPCRSRMSGSSNPHTELEVINLPSHAPDLTLQSDRFRCTLRFQKRTIGDFHTVGRGPCKKAVFRPVWPPTLNKIPFTFYLYHCVY